MKRTLLTILAGTVIVAVFLTWVYLLFWGVPESTQDVLTDLRFGNQESVVRDIVTEPVEEVQTVDIGSKQVLQLTTRPVAGFGFISTSTEIIHYAEQGTGHVYAIDLATGVETRLLNKTFTAVTDAVFSPDGAYVVLVAEYGTGTNAAMERVGEGDGAELVIPTDAKQFSFTENELRYVRTTNAGMVGYAYNWNTDTTRQLFSIPLSDVTVVWGKTRTFIYTNPAPFLKGGVYEIAQGTLVRVGNTAYGLSAVVEPESGNALVTTVEPKEGILTTTTATNPPDTLPLVLLPEKCTYDAMEPNVLWCGADFGERERTFQRDWYMGMQTTNDLLWRIEPNTVTADAYVNFEYEMGRVVDVIDPATDRFGTNLAFRNKMDNTLWLYRIGSLEVEE
ncbi:MAG: hypothetical protein WDZ93_04000 [Candidatus Paceibacterota bacterium]